MDKKDIAIRAQDVHTGTHDQSGLLLDVWYTSTRLTGMAAKLGVNIRGIDVISDFQQVKVRASHLGIDSTGLKSVLDILQEVGFITIEKTGSRVTKIRENVPFFSDTYKILGEYWEAQDITEIEIATLQILDSLTKSPRKLGEIKNEFSLDDENLDIIRRVGEDGSFIRTYSVEDEQIIYSPLFWDENPQALFQLLQAHPFDDIVNMLQRIKSHQGLPFDLTSDPLLSEAATYGFFPAPAIVSVNGAKSFAFTPYAGSISLSSEENALLGKARAILACVRYGQYYGGASRIKWPRSILERLLDSSRDHRLNAHTEHKHQYLSLALQGIVRIEPVTSGSEWHSVKLIDTVDNMKSVKIALDLMEYGEQIQDSFDDEMKWLLSFDGIYKDPLEASRLIKPRASIGNPASSFSRIFEILRGEGING